MKERIVIEPEKNRQGAVIRLPKKKKKKMKEK